MARPTLTIPSINNNKRIAGAFMTALLLFTLWIFLPPYHLSFVGDDFVQQWRIREFLDSPLDSYRIFNPFWTDWYFRPLQNLWFLLNRLIFGLKPFSYYYLQICWHLLNVALLFHISRRLNVRYIGAIFAATFFSINAQHALAVSWISSIGIIFSTTASLAAVAAYQAYLNSPKKWWLLLAVLIITTICMAAHEGGILLPIFLPALRFAQRKKPPILILERIFGLSLFALSLGYIIIQVSRPNANIMLGDQDAGQILTLFNPIKIFRFVETVFLRWIPAIDPNWGVNRSLDLSSLPVLEIFLGLIIVSLMIIWFRFGNRAIRLGLIWAILHASFIYLVLWSQRPELFDNRHLYSPWLGICLAIGGPVQILITRLIQTPRDMKRINWASILVVLLMAIFILPQISSIQLSQNAVNNLTLRVREAELQMKNILPEINDYTRLFSTRFILTSAYFPATAAVWYEEPKLSGGELSHLKDTSTVTNDYYLFDYDENGLYNLMPELQQNHRTKFLWNMEPSTIQKIHGSEKLELEPEEYGIDRIIGPINNKRLAIELNTDQEGWTSIGYKTNIVDSSKLAYGILGREDQIFRVRVIDNKNKAHTLFETVITKIDSNDWTDFELPISDFWGKEVLIFFEVMANTNSGTGSAYFANPRLVID